MENKMTEDNKRTAILVDSGCDVPSEFIEKYNMKVMPLRIMYPEKDYCDGIDIEAKMVYSRFPDEIPTTSTPTMDEVNEKLKEIIDEGYSKVIAVCISSGLSGTGNTVRLAAENFPELESFVFDTKSISVGSGIFAIWAGKKLEEGMGFDEVVRGLKEKVYDSKVFFYMDTLKYLEKGGRIGHVASAIGGLLHLKPIISCGKDGIYYTVAKVRGSRQGRERIAEEAARYCTGADDWLIFGHGAAEAETASVESMVLERTGKRNVLAVKQITASLAVHTGPGLVGVVVFSDP
jgi:DegV family protein with EDD domain